MCVCVYCARCGRIRDCLYYNFTEKNKFEQSRATVSTEDINDGEIEIEDSISEEASTENGDCADKVDDTEIETDK